MALLTYGPNGLRPIRGRLANAPNFQTSDKFQIRKGYGGAIGQGDLVSTGPAGINQGYLIPYVPGTGMAVAGVFWGLQPYFDLSAQTTINKVFYSGLEAASGDLNTFVIDDENTVFEAQVNGGPITIANRGQNIDVIGNGAPNILGSSLAGLDFSTVANTATLPLRIIGLSTIMHQSFDPTIGAAPQANNYVEVILNPGASEFRLGLGI